MPEHCQMRFPLTLCHEWVDRLPTLAVLQGILPLSVELADDTCSVLEPPKIVDTKHLARIERVAKLHLQLWHRKTVCNKERPKTRLAAVFGQPVRIRRDHLRSAIPSSALAIGAEALAQTIVRYASCPQCRIGNRNPYENARAAGNPPPCAKTTSPARRQLVQVRPPLADATADILRSAAPSNLS